MLYSNGGSQPGTLFETLSGPANPITAGTYTYTSASTALTANTTYWWVAKTTSNGAIFNVNYTSSTAEDAGAAAGWSIGDVGYAGNSTNASSVTMSSTVSPYQFSVDATVVPEPATYAAFAGALMLACAIWSRRRRIAAAAR